MPLGIMFPVIAGSVTNSGEAVQVNRRPLLRGAKGDWKRCPIIAGQKEECCLIKPTKVSIRQLEYTNH
jgi:hypothetical protein